ncbi:acetyltransferase [Streptomyces sp. NBC_00341]|uniref:acetyltransferase n=1 Tax=Streptomyces sp. NBC_00341 TaxID=2975717 RepID=UPI00308BF3D2|nr:acetyltransferase [Streptomyces sp. NBC_00341]
MRTSVRSSVVIASAVTALAALAAVPAGAASAAPTPIAPAPAAATPAGVCGSGYTQIDSHVFKDSSAELARVYLLYNASTKSNCVVTFHAAATEGKALTTGAWLDVDGDGKEQVKDQGRYSSYAGPVRLAAGSHCVKWGGMIETGAGTYAYTSPWSHCG